MASEQKTKTETQDRHQQLLVSFSLPLQNLKIPQDLQWVCSLCQNQCIFRRILYLSGLESFEGIFGINENLFFDELKHKIF